MGRRFPISLINALTCLVAIAAVASCASTQAQVIECRVSITRYSGEAAGGMPVRLALAEASFPSGLMKTSSIDTIETDSSGTLVFSASTDSAYVLEVPVKGCDVGQRVGILDPIEDCKKRLEISMVDPARCR